MNGFTLKTVDINTFPPSNLMSFGGDCDEENSKMLPKFLPSYVQTSNYLFPLNISRTLAHENRLQRKSLGRELK